MGPDIIQLRFATEEQSDASVKRLIEKLPKSADIWVVAKELVNPDLGTGD